MTKSLDTKILHADITEKIIQSFFEVNKVFTYPLPTDFFRNALAIEFEHNGLKTVKNYSIEVKYRDKSIGNLSADFLINNKVLVLVVCTENIDRQMETDAKLLLRNSKYEVLLILNNFGDREFKRFIFTNDYKSKK